VITIRLCYIRDVKENGLALLYIDRYAYPQFLSDALYIPYF